MEARATLQRELSYLTLSSREMTSLRRRVSLLFKVKHDDVAGLRVTKLYNYYIINKKESVNEL